MRPPLAIIVASLVLSAAAARAAPGDDEVIATAQAKPSAQALTATTAAPTPASATPAKPMTTQEQIAAFIAANPSPRIEDGPRGIVPASRDDDDRDADGKRQIHGSAGFSVGSGGYRSAYASALMPVGENTTIGVAVSKTDYGKRGAYLDPYYGYGAGYGYGGPWRRGGESQSLALSVMTGSGRGHGDVPAGCAPGFRDGSRYVEPLWVQDMRADGRGCPASEPTH
jgi:hypothetical protein